MADPQKPPQNPSKNKGLLFPIDMNIVVSKQNNKPMIELRKVITDPETIKYILSNAWQSKSIPCTPIFQNRIKSIGSLINIGIICFEKDSEEYCFLI